VSVGILNAFIDHKYHISTMVFLRFDSESTVTLRIRYVDVPLRQAMKFNPYAVHSQRNFLSVVSL
jgi:hypothetical protein